MKSRRPSIFSRCIAGACVVALAATAISATRSNKAEIARNLDIFNAVYKELQTNYVDSIDSEKAVTTAIDAMLSTLDPYTTYYPASDQDQLTQMTSGEYGGIGAYIMQRPEGGVQVTEPRDGTPSQKAGLRPGDMFLVINGDSVTNADSKTVSNMLRGQAGTDVKVTVKRPYVTDSILDFTITRSKIDINPVPYYGVERGDIGYIQLTTFNDKTYEKTRDALKALKSNPAVKSIVLDLRGNGGGLLESAVQVVSLFVPKGTEVLRTRGKGLQNERIYKTPYQPVDTDIPLAVLVNSGSASSARFRTSTAP